MLIEIMKRSGIIRYIVAFVIVANADEDTMVPMDGGGIGLVGADACGLWSFRNLYS